MTVTACGAANKVLVSNTGGSICVGQATGAASSLTAANVGVGEGEVFRSKASSVLSFRTLTGLGDITVDTNGDLVRIDGSAITGIPGGSDNQLQFNDSGSFGGAELYWDGTQLGVGLAAPASLLHMRGANPDLRVDTTDPTGYAEVYFTTEDSGAKGAWDVGVYGSSHAGKPGRFYVFQGPDITGSTASSGVDRLTIWQDGTTHVHKDLNLHTRKLIFGSASDDYILHDDTADEFQFWLDAGEEWTFSDTVLDCHSNDIDNANSVRFDLTPVNGAEEGRLLWDETEKTLSVGMPGGVVNLQIGQEFLVRVKNVEGSQIDNGQVVRQSGNTDGSPNVVLADNSSLLTASVVGMATEDIANNQFGYITTAGKVNGLDTSSWPTTTPLWLGTNGDVTAVRPVAPLIASFVGQVIRQDSGAGNIYLRPTIVQRISWGSDCNILDTTLGGGDMIGWDIGSLRWDRVLASDVGSRNGFPNRTDSAISWTDTGPDRTFSIQPTGASFSYFDASRQYTSTGDTLQIADTEGVHAIYYDGDTLTEAVNPSDAAVAEVIRTKAIVAIVVWDAANSTAVYVGEERHGRVMSPDTHDYLHFVEGCQYLYGLGLNTFSVDGTGTTADAQFGVDAGGIVDEDVPHITSAILSTAGLPIYHLDGANGDLRKTVVAGFAARTFDGTSATTLAWNEFTGGAWQLTAVASNRFVLYHVFGTSEKDASIVSIMGQETYLSRAAARAGASIEIQSLVINNTLFPEFCPLATVIYQTNTGYASAINAKVVSTDDGDNYVDWRNETVSRTAVSTSDHGALTGRGDDDHTQYSLVDGTRNYTGNQIFDAGLEIGGTSQDIYLNGATSNLVQFNDAGFAPPSFTTRSLGTKVVLFPKVDGDDVDYALGVENGGLWYSAAKATSVFYHRFYFGQTETVTFRGDGRVGILQGNPAYELDVTGVIRGTGILFADGTGGDTTQLVVRANASQSSTNPLIQLKDSANNPILEITSNVASNVFMGVDAGDAIQAGGVSNTCVGHLSGTGLTTGDFSAAFGANTLGSAAAVNFNSAFGYGALYVNTVAENTAVGALSGRYNTSGTGHAHLGFGSGRYNVVGNNNTCLGYLAGQGVTANSNSDNTFAGYMAGTAITTGTLNTAAGSLALTSITEGSNNTASGYSACAALTSGDFNVGAGSYAVGSVTTQDGNTAVGYAALFENIAANNSAFGFRASQNNTSGIGLVNLGHSAGRYNAAGNNNTCVGAGSGTGVGGNSNSDNTFVGRLTGTVITTGGQNLLAGSKVGDNLTTGSGCIILGYDLEASAPGVDNELNIGGLITGDLVLKTTATDGTLTVVGQADTPQFIVKANATQSNTNPLIQLQDSAGTPIGTIHSDSTANIYVGLSAGDANSSGTHLTAMGSFALTDSASGDDCSAYGYSALANSTAGDNDAFGSFSQSDCIGGIKNASFGSFSLRYNESGNYNSCFGGSAGSGVNGNSFSGNSLFGYATGSSLTIGSNNLLAGYRCGDNLTTGDGNIILGYDLDASAVGVDNELNIGGLITGDLVAKTVEIDGTTTIDGTNNDAVQLIVKAHATQTVTNPLIQFQNSAGTPIMAINSNNALNVAMGVGAGDANSSGYRNTAVGANSLSTVSSQLNSSAFGAYAGEFATGNSNTFAGVYSGQDCVGGSNAAFGANALQENVNGAYNTCVGASSGLGVSANSFHSNTLFGHGTGSSLTTGSTNLLGGRGCGDNLTTGGGNIILGYDLDASAVDVDNELNIGGTLFGDLSANTLRTASHLEIDGDLDHDGSGVGFYGTAPVAKSAAYTPTNVTPDRAYDANSTTVEELADVLGTLIADLQATGLLA